MRQCMREWTKLNLWKTICLSRPYHLKFLKSCLPQILLDPFFEYIIPNENYIVGPHQILLLILSEFNRITSNFLKAVFHMFYLVHP